jgi:sucrose-6-phosphate hydrolase SacC (GH32 family)
MFSGTGFITIEGRPAVIYHGQGSGRNQIAIAKDHTLTAWEKPCPVEIRTSDGKEAEMRHWDPDCFRIGRTYYGISGGHDPPLFKSTDLKNWTYVGDFLSHNMPDVAYGEDISCPNFFKLGNKWMLLCISHPMGCRYYLGDWDAEAEQFVPQSHGRMNWRREGQDLVRPVLRDFFAPESVLTPDGRRVMWAWLATLDEQLQEKTIQSLPRELSLAGNGSLRIHPLRELETLRHDPVSYSDIKISPKPRNTDGAAVEQIATLDGEACEILIVIDRLQADRKQFGFRLFSDADHHGLPILFRPETGTMRLGGTEAPFAVEDLPPGEDLELRIFIDKYLVEVFVNGRQAMVAACKDYMEARGLGAHTFGRGTTIKKMVIWRLKPANQGYREARQSRIWVPDTKSSADPQ